MFFQKGNIVLFIILLIFLNLAIALDKRNGIDDSVIPNLDKEVWDPVFYKYKIVNNLPLQYDKKTGKYFFNPIYPVFFYMDYIRRYKQTKDRKYLRYIKLLTGALLPRSELIQVEGITARVFYYEPSSYVSRMYKKHYSGLTNSYYAKIFATLYSMTNDSFYKKLALEFINSLYVPIKKGGVLFRKGNLYSIAEVPMEPHGWILNGWLTTIKNLDDVATILKDEKLKDFILQNINTNEFLKFLTKYNINIERE